jgi:plasmid stability protein
MPDLIIRNLPQSTIDSLSSLAARAGLSREAWLRRELARLSEQPLHLQAYALKAIDPSHNQVTLRRHSNGCIDLSPAELPPLTEQQNHAVATAEALLHRNQTGDRERATAALLDAFESVYEIV